MVPGKPGRLRALVEGDGRRDAGKLVKVTLHRHPGQQGMTSGQKYWTEINGTRWEVESKRSPWTPTLWTAHVPWVGTDLADLETHDFRTQLGWSRGELIAEMIAASL